MGSPARRHAARARLNAAIWVQRGSISRPKEVVPEHAADRLASLHTLLGHAQAHEQLERLDQEVAAATAGVEHAKVRSFVGASPGRIRRPGAKGPCARRPRPPRARRARSAGTRSCSRRRSRGVRAAAARILVIGTAGQVGAVGQQLARAPGADGVLQQEADHVGLGEELGHGGQLVRPDLHAALG